jgi:hypothetical protein
MNERNVEKCNVGSDFEKRRVKSNEQNRESRDTCSSSSSTSTAKATVGLPGRPQRYLDKNNKVSRRVGPVKARPFVKNKAVFSKIRFEFYYEYFCL